MCDVNEMCTKNLKPKLLDLFCGTKSVAHAALNLGFEVTTLDIDARCKPDINMCIHDFVECKLNAYEPGHFDVVWASPPCEVFSAARRIFSVGLHYVKEPHTINLLFVCLHSKPRN